MTDHNLPSVDFGTSTPAQKPSSPAATPPRFKSTQQAFPVQIVANQTQYGVVHIDRFGDVPGIGDHILLNNQFWKIQYRYIDYAKVETGLDLTTITGVRLKCVEE